MRQKQLQIEETWINKSTYRNKDILSFEGAYRYTIYSIEIY